MEIGLWSLSLLLSAIAAVLMARIGRHGQLCVLLVAVLWRIGSSQFSRSYYSEAPALVPSPASESEAPGGLRYGFYAVTCPSFEYTVSSMIFEHMENDPRIAPALLRMVFHDCFVQGCDASVLLNSTEQNVAEKDAKPNVNSLRGFDVIENIKSKLEEECPDVVSCADILVVGAREALVHVKGPAYPLMTGRRDGLTSFAKLAEEMLPPPFDELQVTTRRFEEQGFNQTDLVNLLGGHSIGQSNCRFVAPRLYNFTSEGSPDPRFNANFLTTLIATCPQETEEAVQLASLDFGSELEFDNSYYKNVLEGQAILQVDQELISSADTFNLLLAYGGNQTLFFEAFVESMIKLSNYKVLTGTEGEVRRHCALINS